MAVAVRAAMNGLDQKRVREHAGSTTGDTVKTRARAQDYFARFEGADGWNLLERDMPKRWIAARRRQRGRGAAVDYQPRNETRTALPAG